MLLVKVCLGIAKLARGVCVCECGFSEHCTCYFISECARFLDPSARKVSTVVRHKCPYVVTDEAWAKTDGVDFREEVDSDLEDLLE